MPIVFSSSLIENKRVIRGKKQKRTSVQEISAEILKETESGVGKNFRENKISGKKLRYPLIYYFCTSQVIIACASAKLS